MKTKTPLMYLFLIVILMLVPGCLPNFPQPARTENPVGTLPTEAQETPVKTDFSLEKIRNAEYVLGDGSTSINLKDGSYDLLEGNNSLRVSLLEKVVFADLDGDGNEDAAVILVENYGGTGQFEYLVPVLNFDGEAYPIKGFYLGDRVAVDSMNYVGEQITLDMLVHGPNDGLCCPSKPTTRSFEYYPGYGFRLVHITSGTEGPSFHEILLDTPVSGSTISSQFQVSGSFTVSPFEATLVVRVLDMNDLIIYQGSIMAPVLNLGDPGSFIDMVDMTSVNPPPGLVRVEVFEVSMADGSILVMDSKLVILE
ncbi:Gmad2 immunoglobulin-like domain-containing protein [Chloroflexota bacterium]